MKPSGRPVGAQYVRSSHKSPWLWIIIVVVVAAGGLGAGWYFVWSVTPPVEVVKPYLEAQINMDWATMAKYVTEKDRGKLEGLATNPRAAKLEPERDPLMLPTFTYGETTYQDGKATVAVTATLPAQMSAMLGVKELPAPCVLVKEGREWKVDLKASETAQGKEMEKLVPPAAVNLP